MYFPIFLDLSDKEILVVGAGRIATRRIRVLAEFAGHITVVAPEISPELRLLDETCRIIFFRRKFVPEDLNGKTMVLAATGDAGLNSRITFLCRERGIPVNNCSDRRLCDFQFPSVVRTPETVIGFNASGTDHQLVRRMRQRAERLLHARGASSYADHVEDIKTDG